MVPEAGIEPATRIFNPLFYQLSYPALGPVLIVRWCGRRRILEEEKQPAPTKGASAETMNDW
jgi:hypothetical protein